MTDKSRDEFEKYQQEKGGLLPDYLRYDEGNYHYAETCDLWETWQHQQRKIDDLMEAILKLRTEVNCRIEHGADSNGHLEYVQARLDKLLGDV